ncbi:MAG: NAD(P)H-dependent oxidoreductase subunit E [Nitrospinota bacterium]
MSGTNGAPLRFSDEALAEFERTCARYPVRRSALIPTLRLAQEEFGHLSPAAIRYVAELLDLSPRSAVISPARSAS